MPRKRTYQEMQAVEPVVPQQEISLLTKIRNMWEFASTMQFIFMFGKAVRIDEDFDIEDFEAECLRTGNSEKLEEVGLQLLKWISSHRGLDQSNWDEYTRRQYQSKAPTRNPYGEEEEPKRFRDLDIFTRIRILHQLTVWTLWNPDRIKQAMPDHQKESEQLEWRIDPCGWDEEEREYFVLDDNRLYRRTEPPIPDPPRTQAKQKSKKAQARRSRGRASKRRKVVDSDVDTETNDAAEEEQADENHVSEPAADVETQPKSDPSQLDTLGGYIWECIAVSLDEYRAFLDNHRKSKDINQKNLNKYIETTVLPILQDVEEKRLRKLEARARREALEARIHTAKRSSRLAARFDKEKEDAERAEVERQHALALAAAHREEERKHQMENDRESRMLTREQRIKEREYQRILMEEQLVRDAEEQKKIEEGLARGSARHLKDRIERNKRELSQLTEDEWTFDCSGCGKHGRNFDDGEHSISCERCSVWQHSKCLGIAKSAAESNDFHFVCKDCKRREEERNKPKISLKFKVGQSSSPPQPQEQDVSSAKQESPTAPKFAGLRIPPLDDQSRQSYTAPFVNGQAYQHTNAAAPAPFRPMMTPQTQDGHLAQTHGRYTPSNQHYYHNQQYPNGYPAHERLPGSSHAQNLYNQLTNGHTQYVVPRPGSPPAEIPAQPAQRPTSSHSPTHTQTPLPRRVPSPIVNRPIMSPSQGNHDVGPIAGVPGSSPVSHHAQLATPHVNGSHAVSHVNGRPPASTPQQSFQRTPSFSASQSFTQPLSGLSPTKHQVPLQTHLSATPSSVPQKQNTFTTPTSSFTNNHTANVNNGSIRSVSGTPIFPPVEKLVPSPEMVNRGPVATPSKHLTPRRSPDILDDSAAVQALRGLTESNGRNHTFENNGGQVVQETRTQQTERPTAMQ